MQFNSIEFLFCFLPAFLLIYLLVPERFRAGGMAAASLLYYAFASGGKLWWTLLLAAITLLAYFAGRSLEKFRKGALLGVYLTVLTGVLVFFKLYDGGRYLPAGMSFYLFQIAAYLIDLYRQRCSPERSLISFFSQIVMFPKLLSGPLMEPRKLQLEQRNARTSGTQIRDGMQLLILGLALKVVLANRLSGLWAQAGIVGYEYISVPFAWMALISYAMQLYFDFYGYSLMAMGLGKMMGYDLPRNFDAPYASKTVSEFYRRWHMTLSAWFREYLYIPLGGNRHGTLRTILNLGVVWLFTGLWHGVGGNYLLWAGFLFLLVVNERLWLGKLMKRSRVLCHVYVVVAILLSWLPFAVGDWGQMVAYAGRLFGLTGTALNPGDYLMLGSRYAILLGAGAILATPLPKTLWDKVRTSRVADVALTVLFWIIVYFISTSAQDPFMYFQY